MTSHIAPADAARLLEQINNATLALDELATLPLTAAERHFVARLGRHALDDSREAVRRLAGLRESDQVGRRVG